MKNIRRATPAALALTVLLTGCATATTQNKNAPTGPVTVFAAASLKGAFTEIAREHPDLKVTFNYDGSNSLVDQLAGGARADVLATADTKNMDKAQEKKVTAGDPKVFAGNILVLITPKDDPGQITGLDASLTGKKLVTCAAGVPCGNATRTLAENLGLTLQPVSEETKVTDVRGKVESGEADAGIVYATDAKASGDKVRTIAVPGSDKVVNRYPITLVKDADHEGTGKAFIAAVLSDKGRQILARHGFTTP
ncbi:molybdate transport system substrate-binding protein [Austwickia chelonae]|uniref:Molybdate ABC transporter substrate-binding protein n=1 Tax=Austwickia chelonae NBRC 105200 TaxID=1184607 RepID=K6W978_9MICO|nr:molybdate ABC transporter substrate-binding protein [Austwickia chelonae]GAB78397.1 molybdate ABC transporter substrate-binding protein [Austwickia chelonae NBRC 105200]SEW39210.1 molybdate transport system substrate-binding protein [Austwickia chelonae]